MQAEDEGSSFCHSVRQMSFGRLGVQCRQHVKLPLGTDVAN